MNDREFLDKMNERLDEHRKTIEVFDESARVEVMFVRNFQPILLKSHAKNKNDTFCFTRDLVTNEPVDYNLLSLVDDNGTMAALAYQKGYEYRAQESTRNCLIFDKRNE